MKVLSVASLLRRVAWRRGTIRFLFPGRVASQDANELIQAQRKRKEFRKKTPLSVFIDLDKKQ